jgi:hypothetical protein
MQKENMDKQNKNEYLRFIVKLLHQKYHVNISSLGEDVGFLKTSFRVFYSGSSNLGNESLERLEDYLIEMYGPLLEIDLQLHEPLIQRLRGHQKI